MSARKKKRKGRSKRLWFYVGLRSFETRCHVLVLPGGFFLLHLCEIGRCTTKLRIFLEIKSQTQGQM